MKDCLFCKIAKHKIPAKIHYEDKGVIVIEDINPKAKIHLLIIPKKHFDSLNDMGIKDQKLLGKLLLIAAKIAQKEKFVKSGYKILINNGKDAGQLVPHLHLHLLSGNYNQIEKI